MVKKLSFPSTVLTILKAIPCQMCIYWLSNRDFQFCQPKFGAIPNLQEGPWWWCRCSPLNYLSSSFSGRRWIASTAARAVLFSTPLLLKQIQVKFNAHICWNQVFQWSIFSQRLWFFLSFILPGWQPRNVVSLGCSIVAISKIIDIYGQYCLISLILCVSLIMIIEKFQ